MLKEFRDFAMRGNVVDLAIGVIIGAAFGKIVDSLVNDIIMPIIGALGGADFSNYFFGLSHTVIATNLVDAKKQGPVFAYGNFMTIVVNFLIVAFVLFLVIKAINTFMKTEGRAPPNRPAPTRSEVLLTEIRDCAGQTTGVIPRWATAAQKISALDILHARSVLRQSTAMTQLALQILANACVRRRARTGSARSIRRCAIVAESGIVEVFNYGRNRQGLIPLWVGEGDLTTPDFIAEAARAFRWPKARPSTPISVACLNCAKRSRAT